MFSRILLMINEMKLSTIASSNRAPREQLIGTGELTMKTKVQFKKETR